jgi:hypothetical protein
LATVVLESTVRSVELTRLLGQDPPQIRLPDAIAVVPWSAGFNILVKRPLELGSASGHRLEIIDPLGVEHPDSMSEALQAKRGTITDEANDGPTSMQTVEGPSAL